MQICLTARRELGYDSAKFRKLLMTRPSARETAKILVNPKTMAAIREGETAIAAGDVISAEEFTAQGPETRRSGIGPISSRLPGR
jgi:hypothetical protein